MILLVEDHRESGRLDTHSGRVTGKPEVISSSVGNGHLVTHRSVTICRLSVTNLANRGFANNALVTRVFKVTAAFLLKLAVDFRCFAQCALPKDGTLKVDKLDRLPLLHIHSNQSKVRTALHSVP
jgi:hypothetical protein